MCTFISSDVVLANLLYYHPEAENGIDFTEIEDYCKKIKKAIGDEAVRPKYISFQMDDNMLEKNLQLYPGSFKRFGGKYYKGWELNIQQFQSKMKAEVNELLEQIAKQM